MGAKLGLSLMLMFVTVATGFSTTPPPVTEQTLQKIAGSLEMYVDLLPQMPKIYGYSMEGVFVFGAGADTATFPGPTIEALQGNYLPARHILPWDPTITVAIPPHGGVPTVVHLHGGVHPPQSDGNPSAWFTADFRDTGPKWTQYTYTYPNVQNPGNLCDNVDGEVLDRDKDNFLYHDHALGLTRANLLAGLLGAYASFGLPAGDEFDRHLIIADRSFYADGSLYMNATGDNPSIHPEWQPEYFGEAVTVNGKAWPFLTVCRRRYRFRIINSSNARYFNLSLSNHLPFCVVGSDTAYLNKPVMTSTVLLAPAEIFDVVIDFTKSTTSEAELTNSAPYPLPNGTATNRLNGKVMKFVIGRESAPDDSRIPKRLVRYPRADEREATVKRYITFYEYDSATEKPTHLYINGKPLLDPATETPRPGNTEVWEVINLTQDNHPLHLHLANFQAVRVQQLANATAFLNCMTVHGDAVKCNITGQAIGRLLAVPEHEKTWKNVVKIEPGYMTTVVVKFKLVDTNATYPFDATAEPGYVYHCHVRLFLSYSCLA
ncbi:Multicopper oxidase LPR1 [Ananas comosus]|uniref:Multicopper oxidase LPR1 n=1 Tax=Ananas comosus TaxID=4615 RepID=A0A199VLI1_ANACO|nr:Multicopper oxidase LPR1 [Ananas comosus]